MKNLAEKLMIYIMISLVGTIFMMLGAWEAGTISFIGMLLGCSMCGFAIYESDLYLTKLRKARHRKQARLLRRRTLANHERIALARRAQIHVCA